MTQWPALSPCRCLREPITASLGLWLGKRARGGAWVWQPGTYWCGHPCQQDVRLDQRTLSRDRVGSRLMQALCVEGERLLPGALRMPGSRVPSGWVPGLPALAGSSAFLAGQPSHSATTAASEPPSAPWGGGTGRGQAGRPPIDQSQLFPSQNPRLQPALWP